MPRGKTIQLYLPDGNPNGIKICDMPTSVAKAILIPRNNLKNVQESLSLSKVGVYLLFGENEHLHLPEVYIGEAEDLIKRIKQHDVQKEEYWNFAVAFLSSKNNLNKAHVKFLENHLYNKAKDLGRCIVKNSVIPTQSNVSMQDKDFILDFFDELKILLGALGYPIFEESAQAGNLEIFHCKGKDAEAVGSFTEKGFMVHNGSTSNLIESKSISSWITEIRKVLIEEKILEKKGNLFIFSKAYEFRSPSAAAAVVLARGANGWTEWKNKEGKTIDEIKRKENK
ncbi:MAG TPA: GIY-YIG nuclease family protein [Candidatus Nanoarchaeia archaeon]|nr:GIY-YIG nuclease family protein [Candidatus Nanoarchaeia archaeon]